jgi:Tol biopolymer transport system component
MLRKRFFGLFFFVLAVTGCTFGNDSPAQPDDFYESEPAWSRDRQSIALVSRVTFMPGDIWMIGRDGSNPVNLTNFPPDALSLPHFLAWSPDGTSIAYNNLILTGANIWTVSRDGSNPKQLTFGDNRMNSVFGNCWLLDNRIVYMSWETSFSFRFGESEGNSIWMMHADGTDAINLTPDEYKEGGLRCTPDSRYISYIVEREDKNELVFMSMEDYETEVFPDNPYQLLWSPDHRYGTYTVDYQGLGLISLDDPSKPETLFKGNTDLSYKPVAWSADSERIIFLIHRDEKWSLWSAKRDGSDYQALVKQFDAEPHNLTVSPDGQYIAFEQPSGEKSDVWVMRIDGTEAVNLSAKLPRS